MGTVTPEGLENYVTALKAYNAAGRPVVYDPVGYEFPADLRNLIYCHSVTNASALQSRRD